jgi:hypothetical protein
MTIAENPDLSVGDLGRLARSSSFSAGITSPAHVTALVATFTATGPAVGVGATPQLSGTIVKTSQIQLSIQSWQQMQPRSVIPDNRHSSWVSLQRYLVRLFGVTRILKESTPILSFCLAV